MGNQNQNTEREGLKRSKKCKETKKMLQFLSCATILSLSVGAPQYGGVQPSPPVKTAPLTGSVQCRTEYATLWDTEYKETQRLCQPTTRQECNTVYENQCSTVYKNVCVEQYKTEYEPYTETECVTEYKEDCEYQWEGHGHDKVWSPIAGTCKKNPYETCVDVAKTKEKQVAYPVCNDVPEQKCVSVPRQECVTVPDQVCTNQPLQKCQDVPRQACHAVHKKVPVRVSRQVPKKVCQDGHSEIDVPSIAISGPEIVDARDNENSFQFEKSQVEDIPSDNAIVFGN